MSFSLEEIKNKTKINNGLIPREASASLANLRKNITTTESNINNRLNNLTKQVLPQASKILAESKTELVFILDKSGSCAGLELATCESFNHMIHKEKANGLNTIVTTVLFNHYSERKHDRLNVKDIHDLNYQASGGTALYDTLVTTLNDIKIKQDKDESKPNHTIVVIMTDGLDENSRFAKAKNVENLINYLRSIGWEFIFLGANLSAKQTAAQLGIDPNHAEVYLSTEKGIESNFKAVEIALDSLRTEGKINPDWSAPIKNNNDLSIEDKNSVYQLRLEKK